MIGLTWLFEGTPKECICLGALLAGSGMDISPTCIRIDGITTHQLRQMPTWSGVVRVLQMPLRWLLGSLKWCHEVL